jgi:hypothetical protein
MFWSQFVSMAKATGYQDTKGKEFSQIDRHNANIIVIPKLVYYLGCSSSEMKCSSWTDRHFRLHIIKFYLAQFHLNISAGSAISTGENLKVF